MGSLHAARIQLTRLCAVAAFLFVVLAPLPGLGAVDPADPPRLAEQNKQGPDHDVWRRPGAPFAMQRERRAAAPAFALRSSRESDPEKTFHHPPAEHAPAPPAPHAFLPQARTSPRLREVPWRAWASRAPPLPPLR